MPKLRVFFGIARPGPIHLPRFALILRSKRHESVARIVGSGRLFRPSTGGGAALRIRRLPSAIKAAMLAQQPGKNPQILP